MRLKPYEIQSVSIRFKVWVPVLNRSTTRLYLLGSVKELGAWSMNAAIEATPTKEPHIWTTEAQLTPRSRFEWVWLKIDRKSKKVDWERQVKRYRELDYFSGVIHSVWGEQDEIFFQNSANVEFTTYKKVDEGYVLVITGGAPTLGSWNIQKAIVANEFPYQSGYWKVDVLFDALSRIDFRWAVVKEDDRQNVLVQEKISHQLMGRPTWMRVAAPWMTTGAIVVDTLPLQEILDTKMGRTDILVRDKRTRLMEIKNWLVKFRNPQARPVYSRPSSVLDAENMPSALRALVRSSSMSNWEDENQEDTHLRQSSSLSKTERLSKKLGKDAQKISPVFAIKGKGQTELPTDFANTGFIPEGEHRLLAQKTRPSISLWSLSMGLARPSPPAPGQRHQPLPSIGHLERDSTSDSKNEAETSLVKPRLSVPNDIAMQVSSGEEAEGIGAVASTDRNQVLENFDIFGFDTEKARLEQETNPEKGYFYDPEKIFENLDISHATSADENKEERRLDSELEVSTKRDLKTDIIPEQETTQRELTAKCTVPCDNTALLMDYDQIPTDLFGLPGATLEGALGDASEFFKSLELSFQEENQAIEIALGKASSCDSNSLITDSGLSNDVNRSFSATALLMANLDTHEKIIDNTQHVTEIESLGESRKIAAREEVQLPDTVDIGNPKKDISGQCSRGVDEGFSEPPAVDVTEQSERETFHIRNCSKFSDGDGFMIRLKGKERRSPHWQRIQHSRELAAPLELLAESVTPKPSDCCHEPQPEPFTTGLTPPAGGETLGDCCQEPQPEPFTTGLTPPLPPAGGETLGDLFERYGKLQSWRCWTQACDGTEEDEDDDDDDDDDIWGRDEDLLEVEEMEKRAEIEEGLHADLACMVSDPNNLPHVVMSSHEDRSETFAREMVRLASDMNVFAENKESSYAFPSHLRSYETYPPESKSVPRNHAPTDHEHSWSNKAACRRDLTKDLGYMEGECGNALLQNIPCDELSLNEKRQVAQALEKAWAADVEHGDHVDIKDVTTSCSPLESGAGATCREINEETTKKQRAWFDFQPRYQISRCSPSSLSELVGLGKDTIDHRAAARKAEEAWGLEACPLKQSSEGHKPQSVEQ